MQIPTSFAVLMTLVSTWAQSLDLLLVSAALLAAISVGIFTSASSGRRARRRRNNYGVPARLRVSQQR